MKRFCAACIILLLLLTASLLSSRALSQLTDDCIQQLSSAQQRASEHDWEQARTLTQRAFQRWQAHRFSLYILLRHDDADDVLISFRCVEQYLQLEEMDQYAAANITLITQLELLAEMEQVSLENIL